MKDKIISVYKNNKRNVIICGVLLLIIIIVVVALNIVSDKNDNKKTKKEPEQVANTNAEVIKDSEFRGIKFTNTMLIVKGGESTLTMDATNMGNDVSNVEQVNIELLDKNGNVITTLLGYIGEDLKPGEVRTITASVSTDLKDAVKKEIKEYKKDVS